MTLKVQDFHKQPSLVFLHGWGVNNGVFEGVIPHIRGEHGLRFVDLPGFGQNHHIDISELEFSQYCDLIAAYIPDGASLVGWSLGGLVAQHIAITHPDKINKLVLICSSPFFMDEAQTQGDRAIKEETSDAAWRGIKPQVLENFQAQLGGDFKKTLERFLAIQALGSETAKTDLKTIKTQIFQHPQPGASALKKGLEYLQTIDLRDKLNQITCETLRVFGSQDSLVPKTAVEKIREAHPEAKYHIITRASHAPFISHTDHFMQIFRAFL